MNDLAKAVMAALTEYGEGVTEGVKEATQQVAKECAKDIKTNALAAFRGTEYAKSWRVKKIEETPNGVTFTIYSPRRYMLAHLLEHGHAKRNGGRVEGRPHIGPAEQKASEALEKKVKVICSK